MMDLPKNKHLLRKIKKEGDVKELEIFLHGKDVDNIKNKLGDTVLHYFCNSSKVNIGLIRAILQHGADPDIKDNAGKTPLHFLCKNEDANCEIIKLMIEYGADPNLKDYYGFSPFDRLKKNIACSKNLEYLSIIKPFRKQLDLALNIPWRFEEDPFEITNLRNIKNDIIWRGELKDGKQWKGYGVFMIEEQCIWVYEGMLVEGNFEGEGKYITYSKRLDDKNEIEKTEAKLYLKYDKRLKVSSGKMFENGKEYFVDFKDGKEVHGSRKRTFEGVRIMVIGNARVGRTNLAKKLVESTTFDINKKVSFQKSCCSSEAFEIDKWEDLKNNTLISLWDFKGHSDYLNAHSFFFGSGSVYLLIFDSSLPLDRIILDNNFLFWFHFLQTQAGKYARVVLVGTKVDVLQKEYWFYEKEIKTLERIQLISSEIEKLVELHKIELQFFKCTKVLKHLKGFKKSNQTVELMFFPVNIDEKNLERTGILNVYNTLLSIYPNVCHSVSTTQKHKIVFEAIGDLIYGTKSDLVMCDIKEMCTTFIDSPFLRLSNLKLEIEKYKEREPEAMLAIEQIEEILVDLDKLGVVVYCNKGTLKEVIVADPQWFNNIFVTILENGKRKIQLEIVKIYNEIVQLESQGKYNSNYKEKNIKAICQDILNSLRGNSSPSLSIEEIWDNDVEKMKSNVNKVTFEYLSDKFNEIQYQLYEDKELQEVFEKLDISKYKYQDIQHTLYFVDEEELQNMISEILSSNTKHKPYFRNYLLNLLLKKEFVLRKGNLSVDYKQQYFLPLLIPTKKPKLITLNGAKLEDVKRTTQWTIDYHFPFKPPSLWKILFLKLRKACVESEEKLVMIDEIYWSNGFIFNFNYPVGNKQSTIVRLKIIERTKIEKSDTKIPVANIVQESLIVRLVIQTNEEPNLFFSAIHNTVKQFVSKCIFFSVSNQIYYRVTRMSVQSDDIQPLENLKSKEKRRAISTVCSICNTMVAIDDKLRMCENCTSKHFLSNNENQFTIIKTVAESPYGRIFKARHKISSSIVAIKERTVESEESFNLYQREIEQLKFLEKNITNITTCRLISTLDDKLRNIKDRYLILEWVEGGNMLDFNGSQTVQTTFKTERDFVRMMLMLLHETQKLHKHSYLHRDIQPRNVLWFEKKGSLYFILVNFASSVHIEENFFEPAPTSGIYSAPEQKEYNRTFLSDIYSLGMTFKHVLTNSKIKVSEEIYTLLENMALDNIEKRVDLDYCINFLMDYIKNNSYHKHIEIYRYLVENKEFTIPHAYDINKIRNFISNKNKIKDTVSHHNRANSSIILSSLLDPTEIKGMGTEEVKRPPKKSEMENFAEKEKKYLNTIEQKDYMIQMKDREIENLRDSNRKEIELKNQIIKNNGDDIFFRDKMLKLKDDMVESKSTEMQRKGREIEMLRKKIKELKYLLDEKNSF